MILFDLRCSRGHRFEAWFRDGNGFERLAAVGEISCAVCGDTDVKKALMAPNVRTSRSTDARSYRDQADAGRQEGDPAENAPVEAPPAMHVADEGRNVPVASGPPLPSQEKVTEAMHVLRQVQTHIEKTFDHVGRKFADEARKMHYGEAEKRSIYGEATREEADELRDEGIDVNQIPWLPTRNS